MRVRNALGLAGAAVVVGFLGGCAGAAGPGPAATGSTPRPAQSSSSRVASSTPSAVSLAPEQICRNALGAAVLLDWAPGTVAQFRTYQYSGPTATVPLADAFPAVPASTRGAWCGTKAGAQATHWWAAIPGQTAASVIIIHGPGEGISLGSVTGPPRIP
jgi:hypothetical protein